MTEPRERRGLGRGLAALMGEVEDLGGSESRAAAGVAIRMVALEQLHPNPDQPRRRFPPHALEELAASIRSRGILQPLIVRPVPEGSEGHYQIVAGERRWRAAQLAQVHELPVLVRDLDDGQVLEIGIIENIQRADLNILEEADAYRQLMDRFGHTQEQLSAGLGKSRSHIANTLRLLSLPEEVKAFLRDGRISAGHARALITAADPVSLALRVLDDALTVRDTEKLAREQGRTKRSPKSRQIDKDADTRVLEQDLSATLGMGVVIDHDPESAAGQLKIKYRGIEELDRLCQLLSTSR